MRRDASEIRAASRALLRACAGGLALGWLLPAVAAAQHGVVEPGFAVTTLPSGGGALAIECSPGGIWGDFVYVSESFDGAIDRIDPNDQVSTFTSSLDFPTGMTFGPGPGANFGNFLYVAQFDLNVITRVDTLGVPSAFATVTDASDAKFDPSGAYGTDLFTTTAFSGPILTVDPMGASTSFATSESTYLRFGPGGAFGSGLYASSHGMAPGIVTVDSGGTVSLFATGFSEPQGFDWAFGKGFGGDLFATDIIDGAIYRVASDGSKSLFATLDSATDVAFCNDALYAVDFNGGRYKVAFAPSVPSLQAPGLAALLLLIALSVRRFGAPSPGAARPRGAPQRRR